MTQKITRDMVAAPVAGKGGRLELWDRTKERVLTFNSRRLA